MQAPWLVLRHVEHEHLGTLAAVLAAQGIPHRSVDVFAGAPVPANIAGVGGLIIMGGPMGVYDQEKFPFLAPELALIGRAARAGLPVLGICLGAQMIAAALGARVYASGNKEIGWYEVRTVAPRDPFVATLPERFMGFHWHGDTFELPAGAVRLFESEMFPQQGFRWGGNVLAVQFHLEVDRHMVAEWLQDGGCRAEIATLPGPSAPDLRINAILCDTAQHGEQLEKMSSPYFANILAQMDAEPKS